MSDSIIKVDCSYYGDGVFFGLLVVTDNADKSRRSVWSYGNHEFFDPVLDFLNKNYTSLIGKNSKGLSVKKRLKLVVDDLAKLEGTAYRKMVDLVILSDTAPNISCEQKYVAYLQVYGNSEMLDYSADSNVEILGSDDATLEHWYSRTSHFTLSGKYTDFLTICDMFTENGYSPKVVNHYHFESICDMIRFLTLEMIRMNVSMKICKNCGKYFVPSRSDALFCSGVSPQDENKTCQEYGKYNNYLEKTRTDEATRLYKQVYNTKKNKVRQAIKKYPPTGNPVWNTDLEGFIAKANVYKSDIKSGAVSDSEYIEWLKSIKERKVT